MHKSIVIALLLTAQVSMAQVSSQTANPYKLNTPSSNQSGVAANPYNGQPQPAIVVSEPKSQAADKSTKAVKEQASKKTTTKGKTLAAKGTSGKKSAAKKGAGSKKHSLAEKSDSTTRECKPQDVLARYAQRFNVSDTAFQVPSLYLVVDEWLGTPYRYGRNDKKGTDCSGLVGKIFSNYISETLPRSASGMSAVIDPKPIEQLKEGDLVFFNYRGRTNSHVGLYLKNGWFIHASNVNGVTLNNLNTDYYRKRFSKGGPLKIGDFASLAHAKKISG